MMWTHTYDLQFRQLCWELRFNQRPSRKTARMSQKGIPLRMETNVFHEFVHTIVCKKSDKRRRYWPCVDKISSKSPVPKHNLDNYKRDRCWTDPICVMVYESKQYTFVYQSCRGTLDFCKQKFCWPLLLVCANEPYHEGTFYDFARYVHFKEGTDFFRSDFSGADWEREREQETFQN